MRVFPSCSPLTNFSLTELNSNLKRPSTTHEFMGPPLPLSKARAQAHSGPMQTMHRPHAARRPGPAWRVVSSRWPHRPGPVRLRCPRTEADRNCAEQRQTAAQCRQRTAQRRTRFQSSRVADGARTANTVFGPEVFAMGGK